MTIRFRQMIAASALAVLLAGGTACSSDSSSGSTIEKRDGDADKKPSDSKPDNGDDATDIQSLVRKGMASDDGELELEDIVGTDNYNCLIDELSSRMTLEEATAFAEDDDPTDEQIATIDESFAECGAFESFKATLYTEMSSAMTSELAAEGLTFSEEASTCMVDQLVGDFNSLGEFIAISDQMDSISDEAAASMMVGCLDEDGARDFLVTAFSADGSMTVDQADCLVETLTADGEYTSTDVLNVIMDDSISDDDPVYLAVGLAAMSCGVDI